MAVGAEGVLKKPLENELHCVSEKVPTFELSVTLSNLNQPCRVHKCYRCQTDHRWKCNYKYPNVNCYFTNFTSHMAAALKLLS